MTLPTALVNSSPSEIDAFSIKQIVALCGDGKLTDNSVCSQQFREYLQIAKPENLRKYLQSCLDEAFEGNGFVLQDIVNEFGRRLEYTVDPGLYRGKKNKIGFDGLWIGPDGQHQIVVEVKTTDAYTMSLDTTAKYRDALIDSGTLTKHSSILLVLGRDDTGSLEPQVRGSKHAWMTRIISAEALAKLVALKQDSKPGTVEKIHDLLVPFEVTKLDTIIEIAFAVAEDTSTALQEEQGEQPEGVPVAGVPTAKKQDRTPPEIIAKFRAAMLDSFAELHVPLVKKSRALFWSADKSVRAVFTVSKEYQPVSGSPYYWFAYHSDWDKFLADAIDGFYVLGCIGRGEAYALPYAWIHERMPKLNMTKEEDRYFCHVFLYALQSGALALWMTDGTLDPIEQFKVPIHAGAELVSS